MASRYDTKEKKKANAERMRNYRKLNPDIFKNIYLKKNYGITLDLYNYLLEQQNYSCAICNESNKCKDHRTGKIRRLAVDHCHKTGKVRGLLCSHCNRALGFLRDDIKLLKCALKYREKFK